jgi:hypothetical protein
MTDSLPVLLHAAARGARLQLFDTQANLWIHIYPWELGEICDYDVKYKLDPTLDFRIYPKHHHLRYGPISSVLYEAAKEDYEHIEFDGLPEQITRFHCSKDLVLYHSAFHRSMFFLLVAESLIEDGL